MGRHVDLLRSLPKVRRDIAARRADKTAGPVAHDRPSVADIARQYGRDYFDGDRKYGYGGYHYDGRWQRVAEDIAAYYELAPGARVLDVGCAKGFLVSDLVGVGLDAYGLDISQYAVVEQPHPLAVGRLHLGSADALPFPDQSFDLVLSINTLHNLPRPRVVRALREIRRVSRGGMFVQVDSYRTPAERALFEDWVLTALTHGTPEFWKAVFADAAYDGDYAWTVLGE